MAIFQKQRNNVKKSYRCLCKWTVEYANVVYTRNLNMFLKFFESMHENINLEMFFFPKISLKIEQESALVLQCYNQEWQFDSDRQVEYSQDLVER